MTSPRSTPPSAPRTSTTWIRVAPLSRAYGLTSLTYVLIPLASIYAFGEEIRRPHALGIVLIVVGIACVVSGD